MSPTPEEALATLRELLIACDSELSAQGHGRPASHKEELLQLSLRCREAYDSRYNPELAVLRAALAPAIATSEQKFRWQNPPTPRQAYDAHRHACMRYASLGAVDEFWENQLDTVEAFILAALAQPKAASPTPEQMPEDQVRRIMGKVKAMQADSTLEAKTIDRLSDAVASRLAASPTPAPTKRNCPKCGEPLPDNAILAHCQKCDTLVTFKPPEASPTPPEELGTSEIQCEEALYVMERLVGGFAAGSPTAARSLALLRAALASRGCGWSRDNPKVCPHCGSAADLDHDSSGWACYVCGFEWNWMSERFRKMASRPKQPATVPAPPPADTNERGGA